ncbi:MAG: HAD-IC family P-type ATPase [Patescibacteria group bacterium]|nr:HAD-IC family P-type ATPase [Patescibacteria group bacterium]
MQTNLQAGLSEREAKARLLKFGPNLLPERSQPSWFVIFFNQFKSSLIYILLACAVIVFFLGEVADASIILAVLLCNAVIGAVQEGRSGQVLESLKKLSSSEATVVREGEERIVSEAEVVPGDMLILQEGQKVTADARIISSYNLGLDESALTGETGAVPKKDQVFPEDSLPASSQHNMAFKGTQVLTGNGRAAVIATASGTEIGKISKALLAEPKEEIPLQKNIRLLSQVLVYTVLAVSAALFVLGLALGREPREMFALVVSLAVSIIPEGLPLVLTVILAHGVWRMSKHRALVKKLQAVESLGQARVLAVDKTGTITENQMVIKQVYAGKRIYKITGNGYEPKGRAFLGDAPQSGGNSDLTMSATIASLASRATLQYLESQEIYKVSGDPTEAAMAVFGEKFGFPRELQMRHYRELEEIPFDYKNKFRAVFYEHEDRVLCAIAGAPEVVFKHCSHFMENGQAKEKTLQDQKLFEEVLEEFASKGFRAVAFGYKHLAKSRALDGIDDLVFGGLFGIEDSLRPETREAVRKAEEAGVKVVMITGDHKSTAKAIAKEAGIFKEGDLILTGPELQDTDEENLSKKLAYVSVFARVTPEDKMKIIKAYKRAGLIIAMTGDGVNDAPSLVAADLGVAMGKIGTEVAKEAADIVLLDDNLFSIITAIKEGRVMYQNIKKSLQFLFSTSLGEFFTIVAALVLKMPLPLLAVQILWMNLVTDPLIAAALAVEREEPVIKKNRSPLFTKYFVDWPMLWHMLMVGAVMTVGGLYIFNLYYPSNPVLAQTMVLTLLSVFQWYNGLNCRFLEQSILHRRVFGNKYIWLSIFINVVLQALAIYSSWFNRLLHTTPMTAAQWVLVLAFGFSIILAEEARKGLRTLLKPYRPQARAAVAAARA